MRLTPHHPLSQGVYAVSPLPTAETPPGGGRRRNDRFASRLRVKLSYEIHPRTTRGQNRKRYKGRCFNAAAISICTFVNIIAHILAPANVCVFYYMSYGCYTISLL